MLTVGVRGHDFGRGTPEALFGRIAAAGYHTIQLACKKAIEGVQAVEDITPALVAQTKQALQKTQLSVGVLGCYVEPSLVDETKRSAAVAEFMAMLPVAKALDAGCIGTETTGMALQPGVTREQALRQLRQSLEQILPLAESLGVTVAVEPVALHALATPELTRSLLRDMASKNLKVIFDPVNLFRPEDLSAQDDLWARAFECFAEEIAAVHMKGVTVQNGALAAADFAHSVIHYDVIFEALRRLPQPLPVLREEADPAKAAQDIAFLAALSRG